MSGCTASLEGHTKGRSTLRWSLECFWRSCQPKRLALLSTVVAERACEWLQLSNGRSRGGIWQDNSWHQAAERYCTFCFCETRKWCRSTVWELEPILARIGRTATAYADKGKRPNSAGASFHPNSASPHGARTRSMDSAASTSLHRDESDGRGFGGPPAGDCKAEGASPRSIRRMRSMSAPGTTRKVSMMLKGSEPDEEALRAWLAHKGVKVIYFLWFSNWDTFLDVAGPSELSLALRRMDHALSCISCTLVHVYVILRVVSLKQLCRLTKTLLWRRSAGMAACWRTSHSCSPSSASVAST